MKLVVLPGLDGTGTMLSSFAQRFGSGEVDVIAYPGDRRLSYRELADFVAQCLPSDAPFVLIAESFSGQVVTLLARRGHPGLAGIVFAASFVSPPRRFPSAVVPLFRHLPFKSRLALRLAAPFTGGGQTDAEGASLAAAVAEVDRAVLADRLDQVLRADHAAEFAQLALPMLYLRPRQDRLVPASAARDMARRNPYLAVRELDGPHFILQTRPDEAAIIIRELVASLAV